MSRTDKPKFTPPRYRRKFDVDGKLLQPERDDYWTLVTKRYSPDTGGIDPYTYYYPMSRGTTMAPTPFGILIQQVTNGREQRTIVPWNEVIRWDENDVSAEYNNALADWSSQYFGMSPEDVKEMNDRGADEAVRTAVANQFGLDPDDIQVHKLGDM